MDALKAIGVIVIGLVVAVGLVIGSWNLYWWASNSATNHTAHIYQNSYGAQSADEQEVQNLIAQVATISAQLTSPSTPSSQTASLSAQKQAIVTQACSLLANINSPTPDIEAFASANCG